MDGSSRKLKADKRWGAVIKVICYCHSCVRFLTKFSRIKEFVSSYIKLAIISSDLKRCHTWRNVMVAQPGSK
jgi:hypothetical protein